MLAQFVARTRLRRERERQRQIQLFDVLMSEQKAKKSVEINSIIEMRPIQILFY